MTARYPRAAKPNFGLDLANVYMADLGAPALSSGLLARIVVSANMKVGSYTIANASPADGLARNVTVKRVVVVVGADTPGTITVTGTDVDGAAISEAIIPGADGVVVAGTKAFKTVTAVVGAGWVIAGGADTVEVGFGDLIGLPRAIRQYPAVAAATQVPFVVLGTAIVAATVTFDATDVCKNTVDASSGTYNGTKRLFAFIVR